MLHNIKINNDLREEGNIQSSFDEVKICKTDLVVGTEISVAKFPAFEGCKAHMCMKSRAIDLRLSKSLVLILPLN
jgi:hypothetical protein